MSLPPDEPLPDTPLTGPPGEPDAARAFSPGAAPSVEGASEPPAAAEPAQQPSRPRRIPWLQVAITYVVALEVVKPDDGASGPRWWFGYAGAALVMAVSLAIAFGREPRGARSLFGAVRPPWYGRAVVAEFASLLAVACAMYLGGAVMALFVPPPFAPALRAFSDLAPIEDPRAHRDFAAMVLFAPLLEEAFFRGLLLRALAQRLPRGWAIAASAIAFGAGHPTVVPQFVSGLLYGWLALESGSILPGMLAHALGNFASGTVLAGVPDLLLRAHADRAPLLAGVVLGALMLLALLRAIALVRGRRWNLARDGFVILLVCACADRLGLEPLPAEKVAAPFAVSYSSVARRTSVAAGPDAEFPLPGGRAVLPAKTTDTLEVTTFRADSAIATADSTFESFVLRALLAGRVRDVEIAIETVGPVRMTTVAADRVLRWLAEGDDYTDLMGQGDSLRDGPWVRDDPMRVLEVKTWSAGRTTRRSTDARAVVALWIPMRRDYLGFEVVLADSTEARAVLEALDRRVREIRYLRGEQPGERAPGQGVYRVWFADLGRDGASGRWIVGRGPRLVLLLALLVALAIDYARHGRRRAPSIPEPPEIPS